MEERWRIPSNFPCNIIELLNYSHICTLDRISRLYGNYTIFEEKVLVISVRKFVLKLTYL